MWRRTLKLDSLPNVGNLLHEILVLGIEGDALGVGEDVHLERPLNFNLLVDWGDTS